MSFSKAKIHRFNDDIPCAPPPGAYNPETVDKSVGPKIHKSERFSESNKLMIHASSTESVCSIASEKGTSSTANFATFKTPRIPSTYRAISRTDVSKKGNFSQSKVANTDFVNKKSSRSEREMNPLKYSLRMLQDELALEKSSLRTLQDQLSTEKNSLLMLQDELAIEKEKNLQLSSNLSQLDESNRGAESFSEYLVGKIAEKNNFIDLLTEKCSALQQISVQSFESYQSYIEMMHDILRARHNWSTETDSYLAQLIERYEKLVAEYEQDIESFFVFLVDLQLKQSNKVSDQTLLDSSSEQYNLLLDALKETESGRRKYEIIVQDMQKVIEALSARVHESDAEVDKAYQVVSTLNEEKAQLCAVIRSKDGEIASMRDVVESVSKKFFNEVRDTEKSLSMLVDEFKNRADAEKEKYELDLSSKNSMIAELLKIHNDTKLQLQEALDEIELSKCREENRRQNFDSVQCSLREKCIKFQNAYEECCEKLKDLERTYELNADEARTNPQNNSMHAPTDLVKKVVGYLLQNSLLDADVEKRFDGVEKFEDQMSALQEMLTGNSSDHILPHLMNAVSHAFTKFASDNDTLKSDVTRLRDDFIEKCEECAQLTKLLRLSEKNFENSEKKTTELESRVVELETNLERERNRFAELESGDSSLQQQLAFESNVKESELIIEAGEVSKEEDVDKINMETALKEERMKNEELKKRVAALETLIVKFEDEKKSAAKSDPKVVPRNPKRLSQRNQEVKSKIATLQQKKNARDSMPKSSLLTGGKENQVITKNNETFEIRKTAPADVPMNATYVVTSPKVSRI